VASIARARGAFLKHTLNRLTLRMARRGVGPFSLVRHVGRKSGKTYETPIIIQPTTGGFMVELTYGDKVDWYRNVVAAGGCILRYKGNDHAVTAIEPVDAATGLAAFSPLQRRLLTVLRRSHFVRFLSS
jgi:deazaflavin-dependent oxidoreductase (nitroreductase family)